MASCLGIFIDKNLIKYAKLKKKNRNFKVEAFKVDVFNDLEEAINNAISETNSYKIPISINISNESYNYFEVYSELDKKDIIKSLEIEYEKYCKKKNIDNNNFESRFILTENMNDYEKLNAIYVSAHKEEVQIKTDLLEDYKLLSMAPIAISITNLLNAEENRNVAIINIENETEITIIVDGQIEKIHLLNSNIQHSAEQINRVEMSWRKTYDIFKNITIYNHDVKTISESENEYLDIVLTDLKKISSEVKKVLKKYTDIIDKVYISGIGATINNIDLYFQEKLEINCEILKPFFIDYSSLKAPIKEYIEVNSAISLALDGLDYINKDLNFVKSTAMDNLENIAYVASDFDIKNWKEYLKGPYTIYEKLFLRAIASFTIAIICFLIFSISISKRIKSQTDLINHKLSETETKIDEMDQKIALLNNYSSTYKSITNNKVSKKNRNLEKDAIPNLLNKIMFIIPSKVQLTSIKNTENKHIEIEAISESKEELQNFFEILKTDGVMKTMNETDLDYNDYYKVLIEGDIN